MQSREGPLELRELLGGMLVAISSASGGRFGRLPPILGGFAERLWREERDLASGSKLSLTAHRL
jgi:hypothetical protein